MASDPAFSDRFRREEEIGESLNHPGLLKPVPDSDRSQSYLVTEWFDGAPLRKVLAESKKLPQVRAVRIALNICDALEYIHGHGIVHRNLRPENILVDQADQIKLVDFGVAAKEGSQRLTFTNLAQLLGGSPYISPEELAGKRGDARSDIYALGMILYEMVTGSPSFARNETFERLNQHPIPPSEIEPTISLQLQEVIYRALEREHKKRYASAHDMSRDLRHLDRVVVSQRAELLEWRSKKLESTKKVLLYTAVALIAVIIIILLIAFSHH